MTTQVLKLAWDARVIPCSECLAGMTADDSVLQALRGQAADAVETIDGLTSTASPSK